MVNTGGWSRTANGLAVRLKDDPFLAAFKQCRKNAKARGITWLLTLEQFTAIWKRSKRWHLRGRGRGKYHLARKGDRGAYKVGNVRIILHENNGREIVSNMAPEQYAEWVAGVAKGGYKNKGAVRPELAARNRLGLSEATRAKISRAQILSQQLSPRKHSEATKAKIREAQQRRRELLV